MSYELRPYQRSCEDEIWKAIHGGEKLIVIVLATGTGKTVIFSHLPREFIKQGKKTLILAHREELLTQAANKLITVSPDLRIEIEQGSNWAEPDADVIIASVATLGRTGSDRIKKFNPEHFGLIIIDEAHHAPATTYKNVLSYFGANKEEGLREGHPVVLGVTATPFRKDNVGLESVFNKVVFKYDIKDGIDDGYLARIMASTVFTNQKLDVKMQGGDFAVGELADAINTPMRNQLVVESYRDVCGGQIALCFAADVQHAHDLAELFRQYGYRAEALSGDTPTEQRMDILKKFMTGEVQVVVNCMVLTEGYDNPNIRAVLFARPTASRALFIQMGGRGTRLAPGKESVHFLDFVDVCRKHNIITSSSLIGLEKAIPARGHDIMKLKDKYEELLSKHPNKDISRISIDDLDKNIQEIDIFQLASLPEVVKAHSVHKWLRYMDGYKISLGDSVEGEKTFAEVKPNVIGKYEVIFYHLAKNSPLDIERLGMYSKHVFKALEPVEGEVTALKMADEYIENEMGDKKNLVRQDARWNKEKPSAKQIAFLVKNGHQESEVSMLSKGEASNLISTIIESYKSKGAVR